MGIVGGRARATSESTPRTPSGASIPALVVLFEQLSVHPLLNKNEQIFNASLNLSMWP